MRRDRSLKTVFLLTLLVLSSPAWASSDNVCEPAWTLSANYLIPCANTVMVSPGNDTRANLALLSSEATGHRPQPWPETGSWPESHVLGPYYGWESLLPLLPTERVPPASQTSEAGADANTHIPGQDGTVTDLNAYCRDRSHSSPRFAQAVGVSQIPDAEKDLLESGRLALDQWCVDADTARLADNVTSLSQRSWSAGGADFLAYLQGAAAFHQGQFAAALPLFQRVAAQADGDTADQGRAWVVEAAAYMVLRTTIEQAAEAKNARNNPASDVENTELRTASSAAHRALVAYLQRYPDGAYSESVRGLTRRVMWVQDDLVGLSQLYQDSLTNRDTSQARLHRYVEEGARYILDGPEADILQSAPLFVAAYDLMRLRTLDPSWEMEPQTCCQDPTAPLNRQAFAAQAPIFANNPQLWRLLRAHYAAALEKDPAAVLSLTEAEDLSMQKDGSEPPGDAALSPVTFSLHMVRGQALDQLDPRAATGYWLALRKKVGFVPQRSLVNLALALHVQTHWLTGDRAASAGSPTALPGSPSQTLTVEDLQSGGERALAALLLGPDAVETPSIREILILRLAGRQTLRALVAGTRDAQEREKALFALLYKDLTSRSYADLARDVEAMSGGGDRAPRWSLDPWDDRPALAPFLGAASSQGYTCPTFTDLAKQLAAHPQDPAANLCAADVIRRAGLDHSELETALPETRLGGGPSLYPRPRYSRLAIYREVLANGSARAEEKAYALYRAVRCFAPSAYNGCGPEDIPLQQRRQWFETLKKSYPSSRWAKDLKYYW